MALERNKEAVLRYVHLFNSGEFDLMDSVFTKDAEIHGVLGFGPLSMAKGVWRELHEGLGLHLEVLEMVVQGDTVAVRYRETGTFRAPFRGVQPTGKQFEVVAMEWFHLRDGKIAARWGARDFSAIAKQLGMPGA